MSEASEQVRKRLVELGGRTAQDFGVGRILGQILCHLYLTDGSCSLDEIEEALGLSKASVSIAARQLENLGLVVRTWKKGDRKVYYRSADNIATAFQQGLLGFVNQKAMGISAELDHAHEILVKEQATPGGETDLKFLSQRVKRAQKLRDTVMGALQSPLLKLFMKP